MDVMGPTNLSHKNKPWANTLFGNNTTSFLLTKKMENHNQEIEDKAMLLQLASPSVGMKERAII